MKHWKILFPRQQPEKQSFPIYEIHFFYSTLYDCRISSIDTHIMIANIESISYLMSWSTTQLKISKSLSSVPMTSFPA